MEQLAQKYVPEFYITIEEEHYPSSIEWFLANSNLIHDNKIIDTNPTSSKIYDFSMKNYPMKTGLNNLYLQPKNNDNDKNIINDIKNILNTDDRSAKKVTLISSLINRLKL